MNGWNNHRLWTACSKTPNQLLVESSLQLHQSDLSTVDFIVHAGEMYSTYDNGDVVAGGAGERGGGVSIRSLACTARAAL